MRGGAVCVVVCGLAACESQYGAYIEVTSSTVELDHVELHVGAHLADEIPAGYQVTPIAGVQKLFVHDDFEDVVVSSTPTKSLTYYIPSDASFKPGSYVLAIGYASDGTVEVSELMPPEVPSGDQVFVYEVALEPLSASGLHVWGSQERCFAWTRERSIGKSSLALVPSDDSDCYPRRVIDACSRAPECVMNASCSEPCVVSGCGIGHCMPVDVGGGEQQAVCQPEACLDPRFCEPTGICGFAEQGLAGAAAAAFLKCELDKSASGQDYFMPYDSTGYCVAKITIFLPLDLPCVNPRIEHPADLPITVQPSTEGGCEILLPQTGFVPGDSEHFLLAVDTPTGGPAAFVIGIHLETFSPGCVDTLVRPVVDQPDYPRCTL